MGGGQHAGIITPPVKPQLSGLAEVGSGGLSAGSGLGAGDSTPRLFGVPLKYVSLITLGVQNATLALLMRYSRTVTPPDKTYSAALAVFLNELIKGCISLVVAFSRVDEHGARGHPPLKRSPTTSSRVFVSRCKKLSREVFGTDCWKLSIPAILYVIQNNLQYIAASNLDAATFQVTYQMKILTTALFSVLLLRKRISPVKWLALLALAVGVGIVQIQAGTSSSSSSSQQQSVPPTTNPMKGFLAVCAACFTSGLAGVYFEMVLKGSHVDLWVRNVQLSFFSLLPALLPLLLSTTTSSTNPLSLFTNFGLWAWSTVLVSVLGGLLTAIVIKHADNILKGFATSLSIVLSFVVSVGAFGVAVTPGFVVGAGTVLGATWLYNQPEGKVGMGGGVGGERDAKAGSVSAALSSSTINLPKLVKGVVTPSRKSSYPSTPTEPDAPLLGDTELDDLESENEKRSASPSVLAAALRLVSNDEKQRLAGHNETLDAPLPLQTQMSRSVSSSGLSVAGYAYPVQSGSGYYSGSSSHSRSPSPVPGFGFGYSNGGGSGSGQMVTPPWTGSANGSASAGSSGSRAHSNGSLTVPVVNGTGRSVGLEKDGDRS